MTFLFIVFSGWVNRWAGGGWPNVNPPGGPCIVPGLLFGLVAGVTYSITVGVIVAAGFIAWRIRGWGAYIDLGRSGMSDREIGWIDAIVRPRLGHGFAGDLAGLALRQVYAGPFFIACAVWLRTAPWFAFGLFAAFIVLVVAAYLCGFIVSDPKWSHRFDGTALAEWLTGLVWGAAISLAQI